ncbi:MAG: PA2779 family protein [Rhodospirillales bacterium]|nr:PA2779 family protein [Rhodospirillales bacterium]
MKSLCHSLKATALFMALVMAATSLPINLARAAMVGTDTVIERAIQADDRARVMEFVAREEVRRQMIDLGVDPDEAMRRVMGLSDAEIQQIAGNLDQLPAGEGALGVVIGAILIVLLVLLITDLVGVTNVFPFVKSQRAN